MADKRINSARALRFAKMVLQDAPAEGEFQCTIDDRDERETVASAFRELGFHAECDDIKRRVDVRKSAES